MTPRETYRAALNAADFNETTSSRIAALCPYLGHDQVDEALQKMRDGNQNLYLAAPPLRIEGALHRIGIIGPKVVTLGCVSTLGDYGEAYARDILYRQEALEYAQQHWGNSLIAKTWSRTVQFTLLRSSPERTGKGPEGFLWVVCGCGQIEPSLTLHFNQRLDNAIVELTLDRYEGLELVPPAQKPTLHFHCCGHCGYCLTCSSKTICPHCQTIYWDMYWDFNSTISKGSSPLPAKVVKLIQDSGVILDKL